MIRHVVLVRFKPQADTPKILAALTWSDDEAWAAADKLIKAGQPVPESGAT